jgi:hypothetical protein
MGRMNPLVVVGVDDVCCCAVLCLQLIPALLDHPLSELSQHVHFMPGAAA